MKKNEYIEKLEKQISDLTESSRKEIISDYEEHFSAGIEAGKSEEEIANKLGDPESIAREIKTYSLIRKAEVEKTPSNLLRAVVATLGLSFFNLVFIVGPFLGILGVLFGLVVSAITFIGVGVALTGATITFIGVGVALTGATIFSPYLPNIEVGINPVAAILISLGTISFGIFFAIVDYYLIKGFYKLTINYLKLNLNIIRK
jgi:uncharacterized membrane protein